MTTKKSGLLACVTLCFAVFLGTIVQADPPRNTTVYSPDPTTAGERASGPTDDSPAPNYVWTVEALVDVSGAREPLPFLRRGQLYAQSESEARKKAEEACLAMLEIQYPNGTGRLRKGWLEKLTVTKLAFAGKQKPLQSAANVQLYVRLTCLSSLQFEFNPFGKETVNTFTVSADVDVNDKKDHFEGSIRTSTGKNTNASDLFLKGAVALIQSIMQHSLRFPMSQSA